METIKLTRSVERKLKPATNICSPYRGGTRAYAGTGERERDRDLHMQHTHTHAPICKSLHEQLSIKHHVDGTWADPQMSACMPLAQYGNHVSVVSG